MYLESAPINEFFEPSLEIQEGRAELELPVSEKLFHPARAVHGTAYFKALDDAAFFAANSLVEDVFLLTTQFNVYMTRPVSSGSMHAVGEVINEHPDQYIAESAIRDDDGNQLARGRGLFVPSSVELSPEIGYQ